MVRMIVGALVVAVGLLSGSARGQEGAPADAGAALVGFWTIDVEGMRGQERFRSTLESESGRAGLAQVRGVLFEFTPDRRLRTHLGVVDERGFTIARREDGRVGLELEGGEALLIRMVSADRFVQSFSGSPHEVLWTRSWDPLVGTWVVDEGAMEEESWFRTLDEGERAALSGEMEGLRVVVREDGSFAGWWEGGERAGRVRLGSTTPASAGLVPEGSEGPAAHLVRREGSGASLYLGMRTWALRRADAPSEVAIGRWKFDLERAKTMEWLRRAVPEGQTLEGFIRANVEVGRVIEVTGETWNAQAYEVVDERGDQFAAEAAGVIPFWVRVVDEDHISQMAGHGREIPLVRVGGGGGGATE